VAFPVFFDTCAIYGAGLADLFLSLAERGIYQPMWSGDVLDELRRSLHKAGIDRAATPATACPGSATPHDD